jgi:hypothetical protein
MTFDHHAMVQPAVPLPGGERSDRACAIRVRGISFTSSSPLTRNGREAPIPTSPRNPGLPGLRSVVRKSGKPDLRRGEVDLLARPQRNTF